MKMNEMIREKRRELGLTQEQVAEYLSVSTPAVSKWESGSTCPDMALLPALARLLRTDPNTLLCFHENLSDQEILHLCTEATNLIKEDGVEAGCRLMEQKIQEYPRCASMIHQFALVLQGSLVMFCHILSEDDRKLYEEKLLSWYRRVAEDGDPKLKNRALFMLASRYTASGEYEKAQEIIDQMEDPEPLDRKLLQADLWLAEKDHLEDAGALIQRRLLQMVTELYGILLRLSKITLEAGEKEKAEQIADITGRFAALLGMGKYYTFIAPLDIALARKDAPECLRLLNELLSSCTHLWELEGSPLYDRIAAVSSKSKNAAAAILPPLLASLEQSPEYEFLRHDRDFQALLLKYKSDIS